MIAGDSDIKTSILVVEDDPDDFFLTEDVLKSVEGQPYRVAWRGSYESAQELLAEQQFDVALVDYQIGPRTGIDFISEIGPFYPNCPMILLTGLRNSDIDRAAQAAGAADYLPKDLLSAELLDRTIRYTLRHAQRWSLLNSILTNAASGMIALDQAMVPVVWNVEALHALGIERRFNWVSRDDVAAELARLPGEQGLPHEFRNARGEIYKLKISEVPGVGQVIAFNDISEHAEAEDQLREAIVAAEEANNEQSRFLATMSHELRTPLNGILGMVQVLERTSLQHQQQESLDTIRDCSQGLLRLINDILDLSKIEAGAMQIDDVEYEVGALVDSTTKLLAPTAFAKGLELSGYVDPVLWCKLRGDPLRLTQILNNLVGNAIKFTEAGAVQVSATEEADGDQRYVRFDVTDTGVGLSEAAQQQLFQRFTQFGETAQGRAEGTGLGLALCKELLSLMDGDIGCESTVGEGSRFWFRVPAASRTQAQVRATTRKRGVFHDMTFLLVTPESSLGLTVSAYVEALGGRLVQAANSNDALEALERDRCNHIIFDRFEDDGAPTDLLDRFRALNSARPGHAWCLQGREQSERPQDCPFDAELSRPFTKSVLARICEHLKPVEPGADKTTVTEQPVDADQNTIKRQLRILMAEDNIANQRVACAVLGKAGYHLDIATDGNMAVEYAARACYDVILMDVCMPGIDGIEATRQIRQLEQGSDVPIIGLTADVTSNSENSCTDAGMDAHLMKPVDWDQLITLLDDLDQVEKMPVMAAE